MQRTARRFAGLDATQLKSIAAALMVLDHIHYMFSDFLPIPDWFTVLGRLVAPVFLFLLAEGFVHTRSRPRYLLRVWVIAAGMGLIQFLMRHYGLWRRADGFVPCNGILLNFPILFCLWQGMEWLDERRALPGLAALAAPLLWPYAAQSIAQALPQTALPLELLGCTLLPNIDCITDGGSVYILEGAVLYLFRRDRTVQLAAYGLTAFGLEFFCYGLLYRSSIPGFTWGQMFTDVTYCQWMSVFSIVLLALYNGQRGKGHKWWFYAFYPTHVYVLYALSCLMLRLR